jgi:transcriptional regulator with XRE-family HTH domain
MSATQLAKRMGVSQAYIWRRLSGETAFDVDDLERIGGVLDVEPVDLLPRGTATAVGIKRSYVPGSVRPPEHRSKGRPDSRNSDRPKGRVDGRNNDRRSQLKRALTPEEKALIAA